MKDLMYIYDKETFARNELGEIQTNFNFSFVTDGTKDSAKVEVLNYSSVEIEPYSIVKHQATNTYWIVAHDKVIRYANEENYFYTHELELLGAIELLNARDLTDCGFNQNRYTMEDFINRVLKLSNFEFKTPYDINFTTTKSFRIETQNNFDLSKNIDYVKTFENYTPLSALRDFLDGYNCSIKLSFEENNSDTHNLQVAIFNIVSKTGNVSSESYEEDYFNDIQEIKTIDKNSFGTTVISNAQNVISTKAKTYPSSGLVKPTGKEYEFNGRNGTMVVRLPSPAYKVNWVDMATKTKFTIIQKGHYTITETFNPFDDESIKKAFNVIQSQADSWGILNEFNANVNINMLKEVGYQRFYYEDNYDPISKQFISNNYIPIRSTIGLVDEYQTVLSNKEMKSNVENKDNVFYCDRGSNLIEGFTFFGDTGITLNKIDFKAHNERIVYSVTTGGYTYYVILGDFTIDANQEPRVTKQEYYIPDLGFSINYIPMNDIKIKLDNSGTRKDSQLYNQNGKLTDSVALSKSLLSYSKEIESDTITKYKDCYLTYNSNGTINSNIPSVGDLVNVNGNAYVINNISLDFLPNESQNLGTQVTYRIKGEFTMSKSIAIKSLMVNPNQNIRDYGIPQNFNVKRKQLYRDFYELTYKRESDNYSWYLPINKILNLSSAYTPYQEHTAIIKARYDKAYGSSGNKKSSWYYQLDTTTFIMKKSIYEIVDFMDNNIIGYGSQNVWSGFDISRVIDGGYDLVNTPISYVDEKGEVKGLHVAFCTNEQLSSVYSDYINQENASSSNYGTNYSCFIPSDIYEGKSYSALNTNRYDFVIDESTYYKDATEVPVFEYMCQIDDSDDIIIGDNILDANDDDNGYMYFYILAPKNKYNNNNYGLLDIPSVPMNNLTSASYTSDDTTKKGIAKLEYDNNNNILISLYDSCTLDLTTKETTYGNRVNYSDLDLDNNDIIIVRHRFYVGVVERVYYTIDGYSDNGVVLFRDRPNGTPITPLVTPVALNSKVYYEIIPNEGYNAPSPSDGYIQVNNDNFDLDNSTGVATLYLPPCTLPTYKFEIFISETSIANVTYKLDSGDWITIEHSKTIEDIPLNTVVTWYATPREHFTCTPNVSSQASVTITNNSTMLIPSVSSAIYNLSGSSQNSSSVKFYSSDTYASIDEITQAQYDTLIYYKITPISGYVAPSPDRGAIGTIVNPNEDGFFDSLSNGTLYKTFAPCIRNTYTLTDSVVGGYVVFRNTQNVVVTSANLGDTLTYEIEAESGYQRPNNYYGTVTLNDTYFNLNSSSGVATILNLPNCTQVPTITLSFIASGITGATLNVTIDGISNTYTFNNGRIDITGLTGNQTHIYSYSFVKNDNPNYYCFSNSSGSSIMSVDRQETLVIGAKPSSATYSVSASGNGGVSISRDNHSDTDLSNGQSLTLALSDNDINDFYYFKIGSGSSTITLTSSGSGYTSYSKTMTLSGNTFLVSLLSESPNDFYRLLYLIP